jgi:hypothetical protein
MAGDAGSFPASLFDGEAVEVSLPPEAFRDGVLAVRWQGFQKGENPSSSSTPGRPRLELQRLGPAGTWSTVDWIHPREEIDEGFFVMEALGEGWDTGGTVRLVSRSCLAEKYHRVDSVAWARLAVTEPLSRELPLMTAVKKGREEVTGLLREGDGRPLRLGPGEEVLLRFDGRALGRDAAYALFFVSEGLYGPVPQLRVEVAGKSAD